MSNGIVVELYTLKAIFYFIIIIIIIIIITLLLFNINFLIFHFNKLIINLNSFSSLIEKRNSALSLQISRATRSSSQRLHKIRKELKSVINTAKNKWITTTCDKLNESASTQKGTKECWDMVRILKDGLHKPKTSNEKMMWKEDGTRCKSSEENAQVFKEHFKNIYERVPICDRSVLELLPQEPVISGVDHPTTDEEILKAVNSLKNNPPGESGLTFQMFKAIVSSNQTFQLLRSIILDFWGNELRFQN